jgi:hypothetical protein
MQNLQVREAHLNAEDALGDTVTFRSTALTCMYPPPHHITVTSSSTALTCMYPPPPHIPVTSRSTALTCTYPPPPHITVTSSSTALTCMYPPPPHITATSRNTACVQSWACDTPHESPQHLTLQHTQPRCHGFWYRSGRQCQWPGSASGP